MWSNFMNDNQKTITFVIVGAIALLVGIEPWKTRGSAVVVVEEGKKLFPEFTNALSASSLEVVDFDEDTSTIKPFKVAQVDGVWRIPSEENYPADARDHLAAAATALIDLEILGVAGTNPGEQELYGVIDPDVNTLKAGATGVGERVIMRDAKDNALVDLIIGKEVKDQPGVRYVRKTGKDQIYRVRISTDKLSTKFGDWIEKDLLKLNTFDLREIDINDFSVREAMDNKGQLTLAKVRSSEMEFAYDDAGSKWTAKKLIEYKKNKPVEAELSKGEELNTEKLNDLRNSLDDLKIVGVERKPTGLQGDLTITPEVAGDPQALQDLARSLAVRGFIPARASETKLAILSTDGEVICKLKDGVDYVLRFGQVATGSGDRPDAGKDGDKSGSSSGLNRYVMITAQLDDSAIPQPELEPLPGDEPAEEAKKPEETKPGAKKADTKKPDAKKEEEKKAEDKSSDEEVAKKAADEEKRAAIEKENKRKQDEYDEKVKKAEEKVKELNDRFADWYYVISDDVYKKIHLTRADVVKEAEKKPDDAKPSGDAQAPVKLPPVKAPKAK
jgi:hypothetical protein